MFPMHNPHFLYPTKRLLLTIVQEVILTTDGAAHYNQELDGPLLKGNERLGYFYQHGGTYRIAHPTGSFLCEVNCKWEASTKLLELYIAQAKLATDS